MGQQLLNIGNNLERWSTIREKWKVSDEELAACLFGCYDKCIDSHYKNVYNEFTKVPLSVNNISNLKPLSVEACMLLQVPPTCEARDRLEHHSQVSDPFSAAMMNVTASRILTCIHTSRVVLKMDQPTELYARGVGLLMVRIVGVSGEPAVTVHSEPAATTHSEPTVTVHSESAVTIHSESAETVPSEPATDEDVDKPELSEEEEGAGICEDSTTEITTDLDSLNKDWIKEDSLLTLEEKLEDELLKGTTKRDHTKFRCNVCSFSTYRASILKTHSYNHTGERPFKCSMCDYRTAMTGHLTHHLLTKHLDQDPFKCTHCGQKFLTWRKLKGHLRSHTGGRMYLCDVCSYTTGNKFHFNRHLLKHTDDRPFQCPLCPQKAVELHALKLHMQTHTGEKPLMCTHCGYRCIQRQTLVSHVLSMHSSERPFKCSRCNYATVKRYTLMMHEKCHGKDEQYKCEWCDYSSKYQSCLTRHRKTHGLTHTKDIPRV